MIGPIKQGYDKILVLDDDVEPTCKHIDGITKVKSGKNKVYCMMKQFKKYGGNIRLQPNGHLNVSFRKPPYLRQLGNTPIINTKKPTQVKIMNLLNQHEDLDNKELLDQVVNILKEEKQ